MKKENNHSQECDTNRRYFLGYLSSLMGLVAAGFVAFPFLQSWWPSSKTKDQGAPVGVDLSLIPPGGMITVPWRGKPVWIVRRTPQEIASLENDKNHDQLRDPDSAESEQPIAMRNIYRSLNPEYLILVGLCTHLGCIPHYQPQPGSVSPTWRGGFYCPCHGSSYDLAGRVFKGVPAPLNLAVPPYYFENPKKVIIGAYQGA